jgi:hypothetical protein
MGRPPAKQLKKHGSLRFTAQVRVGGAGFISFHFSVSFHFTRSRFTEAACEMK